MLGTLKKEKEILGGRVRCQFAVSDIGEMPELLKIPDVGWVKCPGSVVRVHSLVSRADLNGMEGEIVEFNRMDGRLTLTMRLGGETVRVEATNVAPTDLEEEAELSRFAMGYRIPHAEDEVDVVDARCFICFDGVTEGGARPIRSGCACRGEAGLAHVDCRAKAAEARGPHPSVWWLCATCKQPFTGSMRMGLAQAYWSRVRDLAEEDMRRQTAAHNLASCLYEHGRVEEAEQMQRELHEVQKRTLGAEHPHTLLAASNLATFLMRQSKHAEAEQMLRELQVAQERVFGVEHPNTLTTVSNLANSLADQGKHDEAEEMLHEVHAARVRILGEEDPDTMIAATNLGHFLSKLDKKEEAEQVLRKAQSGQKRILGPQHPSTLTTAGHLATVLDDQGKHAEAFMVILVGRQWRVGEVPFEDLPVEGHSAGNREEEKEANQRTQDVPVGS